MIYRIARGALVLFCFLVLWTMPTNKYEWMAEEGLSTLPVDDNAPFYRILSLLPLMVLATVYFFVPNKREQRLGWAAVIIGLVVWWGKFWG